MNWIQIQECKALNHELEGHTATTRNGSYVVEWSGLDANGCVVTGDRGYNRSFVCDTSYEE